MPTLYPDEIEYSILARYGRHTGLSSATIKDQVFGSPKHHQRLEVPTELDKLAHAISGRHTAASLVQGHTLFNYLAAYLPQQHRDAIITRMEGKGIAGRSVLSLGKRLVPRRGYLAFCPQCQEEALSDLHKREMYWRRAHQVAASIVCASHHCVLRRSTVSTRNVTYAYIPATNRTCPRGAPPVVGVVPQEGIALLVLLARAAEDIVVTGKGVEGADERSRRLMGLAQGLGLASHFKLRPSAVTASFARFWGPALPAMPYLLADDGYPSWWLQTAFSPKKKATADTMLNLLVDLWMNGTERLSDEDKLLRAVAARPGRKSRGAKSGWRDPHRDERILPRVRDAAKIMREATPPVRITRVSLARELGIDGLRSKKAADRHLPQSSGLIEILVETTDAYLRRRVAHELRALRGEGKPMNAREALRRMGRREPRRLAEEVLGALRDEEQDVGVHDPLPS